MQARNCKLQARNCKLGTLVSSDCRLPASHLPFAGLDGQTKGRSLRGGPFLKPPEHVSTGLLFASKLGAFISVHSLWRASSEVARQTPTSRSDRATSGRKGSRR